MPTDRDEALARIYERGNQMRERRKGLLSGATALAVASVVAVATSVLGGASPADLATAHSPTSVVEQRSGSTPRGGSDDDPIGSTKSGSKRQARSNQASDDRRDDDAPERGAGADAGDTGSTSEVTSTTVGEGPSGASALGSTSTSLVCRNSTDPACGEFHYDPALTSKRRAQITITASPASPRVGEVVTFTVRVDDPDGSGLGCESFDADVDGLEPASFDGADPHPKETRCTSASLLAVERYGAWDPPPSAAPRELVFTTTYTGAGSRTAVYETDDAGRCEADAPCPKRSKELVLTVQPVSD